MGGRADFFQGFLDRLNPLIIAKEGSYHETDFFEFGPISAFSVGF